MNNRLVHNSIQCSIVFLVKNLGKSFSRCRSQRIRDIPQTVHIFLVVINPLYIYIFKQEAKFYEVILHCVQKVFLIFIPQVPFFKKKIIFKICCHSSHIPEFGEQVQSYILSTFNLIPSHFILPCYFFSVFLKINFMHPVFSLPYYIGRLKES